jgi:hypothetical protein
MKKSLLGAAAAALIIGLPAIALADAPGIECTPIAAHVGVGTFQFKCNTGEYFGVLNTSTAYGGIVSTVNAAFGREVLFFSPSGSTVPCEPTFCGGSPVASGVRNLTRGTN